MQYLFIFQLHIVCFCETLVFNFAHFFTAHPERSLRLSWAPGKLPVNNLLLQSNFQLPPESWRKHVER